VLSARGLLVGSGMFDLVGRLSEMIARVDEKGRILIPASIRKVLGIRKIVKIRVGGGKVTIEPVEDPLRSLEKLTVKGTRDVEKDVRRLRDAAYRQLLREA